MNRVAVELASTSPIVHNCCQVRYETLGWVPANDREQAESRLFRAKDGTLYLPRQHPVIAIGRASWSKLGIARLPMDSLSAEAAAAAMVSTTVDFRGDWEPEAFSRLGLPAVALPKFDRWSASFTLVYNPHYYLEGILRSLLEHSGRHIGLPQFAPFAGRGPWGRFEVKTWEPAERSAARETVTV